MKHDKPTNFRRGITFVGISLLCASMAYPPTFAADSPSFENRELKDICNQLLKIPRKNATAYLVNPFGRITEGAVDVGDINISNAKPKDEGYLIPTKYKIVISSQGFVPGPALEFLVNQLKPLCPGTSEFALTYNLKAYAYGPGVITEGLLFDGDQFYDSKTHDQMPPKYKFKFSFVGKLISPQPELVWTNGSNKEIDALFVGSARNLSFTLKNIGNTPLIISDLVDLNSLLSRKIDPAQIKKTRQSCADSSVEGREICTLQIQKKSDDCIGRSLPPNGTCNIELEKTSEAPLPIGAVYVLKIKSNYKLGFNPRLEFKITDDREVTGGLKLK